MKLENASLLAQKIIYSLSILIIYILGRAVPLYGVNVMFYENIKLSSESVILQSIGGDVYSYSLFSLGIMPYIMASMFVQVFAYFVGKGKINQISPVKMSKYILACTIIFSLFNAYSKMTDLKFYENVFFIDKIICFLEMIVGELIIIWLLARNKKYGCLSQLIFIFVNMIDVFLRLIINNLNNNIFIPLLVGIFAFYIMLFLENTEKRIPLLRVTINNTYAENNYLAIKFMPTGIMPVMFSTALFSFIHLLFRTMIIFFPNKTFLQDIMMQLQLTEVGGLILYGVCIYALNYLFAKIMLNADELTEQFVKSGDCLVGIDAGKKTYKYLNRHIYLICFFSSMLVCFCMLTPLIMQLSGRLESELLMLPTSLMMVAGLAYNLYEEFKMLIEIENYKTLYKGDVK